MDLKHIETFLCVFEECNITRAAARLNIVQPAVSAQIRNLETELNLSLFERSSRGMVPTPAARTLYRLFEPVVGSFRAAEKQARQLSGNAVEDISVGLTPYVTEAVLGVVLQAFRLRFPSVEVHIEQELTPALIERVVAGQLDLALTSSSANSPNVISVQILEEELVLVEKADAAGSAEPVRFADLALRKLVLSKARHGYRSVVDEAAERAGLRLEVPLEVDASGPLLELIAQSDLATVLPAITVSRAGRNLPLRVRRIVEPSLQRKIWYVHRRDRPLSTALAEFLNIARLKLEAALDPAELTPSAG